MRKIGILFYLSFFCFHTNAQDSAEQKLGTWYMYNGTHQLSKNTKLKTSAHFRYYELASEYQQEIYRLGLNYHLNQKVNVTGGVVYSITDTSYKNDLPDLYEYRFYQDVKLKDNWNKVQVNHRVRLAQRFKRANFKNEVKHRIRYGLFLKYPLSQKWGTYTFSELFIKFATKAFSQNRTGAGFTRRINENLKLKLGYFYTKFTDSSLHRLQLGIVLNTNHIKNKL